MRELVIAYDSEHVTDRKYDEISFAWGGWWLWLPAAWRLATLQGGFRKGSLSFADSERLRLEATWAWVTRRRLDPVAYSRKILVEHLPLRARKGARAAIQNISLPGFQTTLQLRDGNQTRGVGYVAKTHRILHWVYHHGHEEEDNRFEKTALSQWRDQPLSEPVQWRFFDVGFVSPPGFRLVRGILNLGDMEVMLVDPSGWGLRRRIWVRHIYPARLALQRQDMESWLSTLFKKRRGIYRAVRSRGRKIMEPVGTDEASAMRIRARLRLIFRFLLRPLILRIPGRLEASLHQLHAADKLLYLQVAASGDQIDGLRNRILRSIADASQPRSLQEK